MLTRAIGSIKQQSLYRQFGTRLYARTSGHIAASIDSGTSRHSKPPCARSSTRCISGSKTSWAKCISTFATLRCTPVPFLLDVAFHIPPATPSPPRLGCTAAGLSSQARPAATHPAPPARPHDGPSDRTPLGRCAGPRPRRLGLYGRAALWTECRWLSCFGVPLLVCSPVRDFRPGIQRLAYILARRSPGSLVLGRAYIPQAPRVSESGLSYLAPRWTDGRYPETARRRPPRAHSRCVHQALGDTPGPAPFVLPSHPSNPGDRARTSPLRARPSPSQPHADPRVRPMKTLAATAVRVPRLGLRLVGLRTCPLLGVWGQVCGVRCVGRGVC